MSPITGIKISLKTQIISVRNFVLLGKTVLPGLMELPSMMAWEPKATIWYRGACMPTLGRTSPRVWNTMWRGEAHRFITPKSNVYIDINEIIGLGFYTVYSIHVIINLTIYIYFHSYTHNSMFKTTNLSFHTLQNIKRGGSK